MTSVPKIRVRPGNRGSINVDGAYVLYWMTSFRRLGWNFSLQHAADLAMDLRRPLVILEILYVDYPYASARLHRFMLEGMAERSRELEGKGITHYPFVERAPGEGRGLLASLASRACCLVMDDFPSFISPGLAEEAGRTAEVRLELVDSNGLLPLAVTDRVFSAAYPFRRFLQKTLPDHFGQDPLPDPLAAPLPPVGSALEPEVLRRWPMCPPSLLEGQEAELQRLPLDLSVTPVGLEGGSEPARRLLADFAGEKLQAYHEDRNHPDRNVTSGLSPYLHFGNISTHEIFDAVRGREGWSPLRISGRPDGARAGWWGMSPGAEAFLDQLVTWRELGFNMASRQAGITRYESLPAWALETLAEHEKDPRPHQYAHQDFLAAETHDPLWNAAQRQLLEEGVIHNYLRMLWGKKILEWSRSSREALATMLDLNDRFALDGRDPNSYSGIFWCLGRYDRGWPERPVYGKVRSMSSDRTRKKVELEDYLIRFGAERRP